MRRLFGLAVMALTGCSALYDDRCGSETRDVSVTERLRNSAGDSIGLVSLELSEARNDESSHAVFWVIAGERLRRHIGVPRLVASEDTSRMLLELQGDPNGADIILEGHLTAFAGPPPFDDLFTRTRTGGVTLLLETDLPDPPRFVLPLLNVQFNNWSQGHCS